MKTGELWALINSALFPIRAIHATLTITAEGGDTSVSRCSSCRHGHGDRLFGGCRSFPIKETIDVLYEFMWRKMPICRLSQVAYMHSSWAKDSIRPLSTSRLKVVECGQV
ncbi:hypothetical protein QBC35DRAFT_506127 [Podospora australis]|uniref:Uncharacterized protein n=1 Tax=Podospora australis TaxID=1536484 RepID=A0AAN7AFV9_9PEZI|nr:hypothetical protein QBC35DRAFT_506127 [Podospora australis]